MHAEGEEAGRAVHLGFDRLQQLEHLIWICLCTHALAC